MNADDLLRDGDLDGARAALVEVVRSKPADPGARMFLFQLLALLGEWDKARTQLNAFVSLSPEAGMLGAAYGAAIDAERLRGEVFAGRAAPPVLTRDSPWAQDLAAAIGHFAAGRVDDGEAARERAFDAAPETPGTLDGVDFDWIADADGRFGPAFEVIIAGQWGIMPFEAIASITSEGPRDLRDVVWYPVQLETRKGQSVAAMLPARYPGSETAAAATERLGRSTGWIDRPWGQAGSGQHIWSLSGGEDRDLLSVRSLKFA